MTKEIIELTIILFLLILSFIFSGSEVSVFSISEIDRLKLIKSKNKKDLLLLKYLKHSEMTLITILVGNMVANLSASILGEQLSHTIFIYNPFFYSVFIMTSLILLFGEIIPKNIAASKPIAFAKRFVRVLEICNKLFYPIILFITRLIKKDKKDRVGNLNLSKEELISAAEISSEAGLDKVSINVLKSLIELVDKHVTDIMVLRLDISAIDINDRWDNIVNFIKKSPHSFIVFYNDNIDNIIGYSTKTDLLGVRNKNLKSVLLEPIYVPEKKEILSLLNDFKEKRNYLAIILDEYGGTSGLITLKDILDSIFIKDILLKNFIKNIGANRWLVSGNTKVSDLNSILHLDLPLEYNTINGYILSIMGEVPCEGSKLNILSNFTITVKKSNSKIIELMVLEKNAS